MRGSGTARASCWRGRDRAHRVRVLSRARLRVVLLVLGASTRQAGRAEERVGQPRSGWSWWWGVGQSGSDGEAVPCRDKHGTGDSAAAETVLVRRLIAHPTSVLSRVLCLFGWHCWQSTLKFDADMLVISCECCGFVLGEIARQELLSDELERLGETELARFIREREQPRRRVVPGYGILATHEPGPVSPPPPPSPGASNSARPPQ